jgi:hypothetical protein
MAGNELPKLAVAGGSGSWQLCLVASTARTVTVLESHPTERGGWWPSESARRGEMEHVVIMRIDSIAAPAPAMPAGVRERRQTGKLLRQWMLVLV